MFGFLFKYDLKRAILNKEALFWVLIFPFFMATIFGLIFTRMENEGNELTTIPIMAEDKAYEAIFNQIKIDDKKVFDVKKYKNPEQALESGKVDALIKGNIRKPNLVIKSDTQNTAIVYGVVSQIHHTGLSVSELMKDPSNRLKVESILKDIAVSKKYEIKNAVNLKNKSRISIYMYSLLAMICLGASTFGVAIVEGLNLRSDFDTSKRLAVSPVSRFRHLVGEFAAYFLITSLNTIILYAYIRYAMKMDFAGSQLQIIGGLLVGNIMAMAMGMFIALATRVGTNAKFGLSAGLYVFSSFLAGMMNTSVAGFITNNIPLLNYINPATVLTRMFTSLYLFDDAGVYMYSIMNILLISLVLFIGGAIFARRNSNDSI